MHNHCTAQQGWILSDKVTTYSEPNCLEALLFCFIDTFCTEVVITLEGLVFSFFKKHFSVLRLPTKNHKHIVCATNTKSMGISSCSSLPELNVLLLYLVAACGFPPLRCVLCLFFFSF